MIKEAIVKIVNKEDLTYAEAYTVMNEIMSGETTPTQNAAFLAALSTKSARAETTDEIAGCAAAMRAHAQKVETDMELFEIVGTGGDNAQSFNISTTSAIVAAAGGMKVAKHGNRAASSQCGTADCLEALGVNINQSPAKCIELLEKVGMCFFFAQKYHTSMKYVGAIRKDFVVDDYMIYEAKLLGASAVLLICSILSESRIREYIGICDTLGMSALVEVHDESEVDMALAAGARMIGVNNRNLKDFSVDTDNSRRLRGRIPKEVLFVSESGVSSAEDVAQLRGIGADAVLVGETLMRAADKGAKLCELRGRHMVLRSALR